MGEGVTSKKLAHKNAIKHEKRQKKWTPVDFLTTPNTP